MDLSEGILNHVRGLQQDLIELGVLAARHRGDRLAIDRISRRAGLRLDAGARFVQALCGDLNLLELRWSRGV